MYYAAVEFMDDPNVAGFTYWYACGFPEAVAGDTVIAPIGRHNNLQHGIIRRVLFADDKHSPYPADRIKQIKYLIRRETMYKIIHKRRLNSTVTMMDIFAPLVARKAQAGQFVILRADGDGERIPLTIAGINRKAGTVKIIYQVVGGSTMRLNAKEEGESLSDFTGPLGCPTHTDGIKKACIIGGGVGCAIALPIARKLHAAGAEVCSVTGFRNRDLVILEEEFGACSDCCEVMTDDGSYGRKGLVTLPLKEKLENGEKFDMIYAVGPLIMMKSVTETAKPYGIPVTVSMNPIMIDGTGMCGGCRLTVGGKTKFACVDGPDFNGYEVDFDETAARNSMYSEFEKRERELCCNLFKKEVE